MRLLKPKLPDRIKVNFLSLPEFYQKRNRVLILRQTGGLGDILIHRMIFEDFKLLDPKIKVCFACPRNYWEAVDDHPFIDELLDSNNIDQKDFLVSYITTTACGRYENRVAPYLDKNRSDIWAEHCGVKLTKHNMHIQLTDKQKKYGFDLLEKINLTKQPSVLLCPISAMQSKNLNDEQMNGVCKELKKMGYFICCLHNTPIPELKEAPLISGTNIKQWMAVINAFDYIISVDTAGFHFAGGIGKPLTGIFTWADGLIYGKYFNFVLVQKHRNLDKNWTCGPCFMWGNCPKDQKNVRKPCISELSVDDIMKGVNLMLKRQTAFTQDFNRVTVAFCHKASFCQVSCLPFSLPLAN